MGLDNYAYDAAIVAGDDVDDNDDNYGKVDNDEVDDGEEDDDHGGEAEYKNDDIDNDGEDYDKKKYAIFHKRLCCFVLF